MTEMMMRKNQNQEIDNVHVLVTRVQANLVLQYPYMAILKFYVFLLLLSNFVHYLLEVHKNYKDSLILLKVFVMFMIYQHSQHLAMDIFRTFKNFDISGHMGLNPDNLRVYKLDHRNSIINTPTRKIQQSLLVPELRQKHHSNIS